MARSAAVQLCLFVLAAVALPCSASSELEAIQPLKKVVTLLQEMKAQVQKEAAEDLAAYEKYSCWCQNGEKENAAATKNAEEQIDGLTSSINEGVAKEGELKTQIGELAAGIEEDKSALAAATAIREKERASFEATEADMKETIAALEEAVAVLSKVQLLQSGHSESTKARAKAAAVLLQVRDFIQRRAPRYSEVMQKDLFDVLGSLPAGAQSELFLSRRDAAVLQQLGQPTGAAAGAKSYNSRSGNILGVLSEMKDEFGRDLSETTEAETQAQAAFAALSEAKQAEIATAGKQKAAKEAELSQLMATMASAKEDIASLQDSLEADQKLLLDLQKNCKSEEEEHSSRVAARNEEVKALSEALTILSEDDARSLFGKTLSLLQTSQDTSTLTSAQEHKQERAMQRIAKVAKRHGNWLLLGLTTRVRLDGFAKVKEMMDKMLAELEAQQKEEYEKSKLCEKEIDSVEDQLKEKSLLEQDLDLKHKGLSNKLQQLNAQTAELKAEVSEMEVALKAAGEARKEENSLFQSSINDQRATIEILKKALGRLKEYYAASMAQVRAHSRVGQEPGAKMAVAPPKGKDYQKSAGAGGVIQLLMEVIKDAEVTEQEVVASEQKSQADYAAYVEDANASIETDRAVIAKNEEQAASFEGSKSETEAAQLSNGEEQAKLTQLLQAQHTDCDFLLKYYDVRQTARAEEMQSIKDAKAILSGSDFS
eukprot:CAMPEP_0170591848 /NCGR_PEP_ID=MMETSP0224-20130122/12620_1 /TAXON_ID=285029 /ORGANISM="Togula jolla, Strain CCCM 725" /LENGTH=711 /DNA_ID=CAMNT_0010915735 /DNA_START=61 /DNA_END=2196 /DNA_ORIENTATION=+